MSLLLSDDDRAFVLELIEEVEIFQNNNGPWGDEILDQHDIDRAKELLEVSYRTG